MKVQVTILIWTFYFLRGCEMNEVKEGDKIQLWYQPKGKTAFFHEGTYLYEDGLFLVMDDRKDGVIFLNRILINEIKVIFHGSF